MLKGLQVTTTLFNRRALIFKLATIFLSLEMLENKDRLINPTYSQQITF